MSAAASKFCTACRAAVGETVRICPNCGGRNFSTSSSLPPSTQPINVPPQPIPTPSGPGRNPRQTQPSPTVRRAATARPKVPLVQARLLGKSLVLSLIIGVAVTFVGLLAGSGVLADHLAESVSPEQQHQLTLDNDGFQQAMEHVLPEGHPLVQSVSQIGDRLVRAVAPHTAYQYRFHVVENDEVNAFAMPGGEIFVQTGLLRRFPVEAQIAAVLAHEIQHVEQRHATKRLYRAIGSAALWGMAVGVFTDRSSVAAVQLTALKYSRANETEADLRGAQIMEAAGYPRQAMVDMLKGLAAMEGSTPPAWLSSHPDTKERARRVQQGG